LLWVDFLVLPLPPPPPPPPPPQRTGTCDLIGVTLNGALILGPLLGGLFISKLPFHQNPAMGMRQNRESNPQPLGERLRTEPLVLTVSGAEWSEDIAHITSYIGIYGRHRLLITPSSSLPQRTGTFGLIGVTLNGALILGPLLGGLVSEFSGQYLGASTTLGGKRICALVACALFLCGALVAAIWQPDEDTVEAQISRKSESHNNQITPFSNVNTLFSNVNTRDLRVGGVCAVSVRGAGCCNLATRRRYCRSANLAKE